MEELHLECENREKKKVVEKDLLILRIWFHLKQCSGIFFMFFFSLNFFICCSIPDAIVKGKDCTDFVSEGMKCSHVSSLIVQQENVDQFTQFYF